MLNGVPLASLSDLVFPPLELLDTIEFCHTPLFKDKSFLQQKYVAERLSCEEIAAQILSARTTILKYLKLHGIPVRETGISVTKRRQLAYGRRMVKRLEVEHQREASNIEKMRTLRSQGFSYWKIADIFNSLKIPTKTGRGRWHARSVQQILDANSG